MRQQGFAPLAVLLLLALPFAPSLLADTDDGQAPSPSDVSHARVVTVSFVSGTVIARRPGSPQVVSRQAGRADRRRSFPGHGKAQFCRGAV